MCLFSIIDSSKQHHFMINVNAAIQTYCPVFRPGATDETVSLELITDSVRFYSALEKAKKAWDALDESVCLTLKKDAKSRNAFLTCYSLEDYSQMKLLLLSNEKKRRNCICFQASGLRESQNSRNCHASSNRIRWKSIRLL